MKCEPCERCDCQMRGWIAIECAPQKYRWALDRLAAEFGTVAIRISYATDYGRTQELAICPDWVDMKHFVIWSLFGRHPNDGRASRAESRWYDLNDNRGDVDRLIETARLMFETAGA